MVNKQTNSELVSNDSFLLLNDIVFAAAIGIGFEHFPSAPHKNLLGICLFIFTLIAWINDWLMTRKFYFNKSNSSFLIFTILIQALCLSKMLIESFEEKWDLWLEWYGIYMFASVVWNINTKFVGHLAYAVAVFFSGLVSILLCYYYSDIIYFLGSNKLYLFFIIVCLPLLIRVSWSVSRVYQKVVA